MDSFIREQEMKAPGERRYNQKECLTMFHVSKTGYNNWKRHREEEAAKGPAVRDEKLKEQFREIIKKLGGVPGKREFRTYLWRDYNEHVSVKKCKRIMNEMNLVANMPKKDAYKHQATHNHETTAPQNLVNRNFKVGPRKVILTDITYLYYGGTRNVFYLCTFRDAFTAEILGFACSLRMTTDLVKEAYEMMLKYHRNELQSPGVLIHSDQGSQYLETSFRELLSSNRFIQSCSRRANSQDNAPMESFFGRLKTWILDIVALCRTFKDACRVVVNYINDYNTKRYQSGLAGLTPQEFYYYATTGIYPLDNYYGVKAEGMMSISELVNRRLEIRKEEQEKRRIREGQKRARKRKEAAGTETAAETAGIAAKEKTSAAELPGRKAPKDDGTWSIAPEDRVKHDLRNTDRNIRECMKICNDAEAWGDFYKQEADAAMKEIIRLKGIRDKIEKAQAFLETLSEADKLPLWECDGWAQNWAKYSELDYRYEMDGLYNNAPYKRYLERCEMFTPKKAGREKKAAGS